MWGNAFSHFLGVGFPYKTRVPFLSMDTGGSEGPFWVGLVEQIALLSV